MDEQGQPQSFFNRWLVDIALVGTWVAAAGMAFDQTNHNQPAGIAFLMAIGWQLIAFIQKFRKAEEWARLTIVASCASAFVGVVLQAVGWWF